MKHTLEMDSLYLECGDRRILQDIYVKCETGKVTGILGRNGSGKSCLMKIALGSMKSYHKSVRVDGKNLLETNIQKGTINYLHQESFIPKFLKVSEVFKHDQVDINVFIRLFHECEKIIESKVATISRGEIRLVEIFIILSGASLFSILDAPFSNLMPLHIERIIQLINETKMHKGIIITDHLYKHILNVSDELYVLESGNVFPAKNENELVRHGYLPG